MHLKKGIKIALTLIALSSIVGFCLLGKEPGSMLLKYLGPPTQIGTYLILKGLGFSLGETRLGALSLNLSPSKAWCIGPTCIGLGAMGLFLCVFAPLFIFKRQKLSRVQWVGLFFLGLLSMFATNIVRISMIIAANLKMQQWVENAKQKSLYTSFVSGNLGWIMYTIVIILFLIAFTNYENINRPSQAS